MLTYLTIEKAVQGNKLDLSRHNINDDDIVLLDLFLKEHLEIHSLDLSFNRIGDEGAKVLAGNKTLTSLNVDYNNIDDEGAKALAENNTLTSLDIGYNDISAEMNQTIKERIELNKNSYQYQRDFKVVASLLSKYGSFFNNRLPKEMNHLILKNLSQAYELPYNPQAANKIMSPS